MPRIAIRGANTSDSGISWFNLWSPGCSPHVRVHPSRAKFSLAGDLGHTLNGTLSWLVDENEEFSPNAVPSDEP